MNPIPTHHHPDDSRWISEQLALIPSSMRPGTAQRYSEAYQSAYDAHGGLAVFAEGPARREANTRLREFVSRVRHTMGGTTITPPRASPLLGQSNIARSVPGANIGARPGTVWEMGSRKASLGNGLSARTRNKERKRPTAQ